MIDQNKYSLKKFSVTFYDIFGYVVPGYLFIIVLGMYSVFLINSDLLIIKIYKLNVTWSLLLSYVAGHLIQGISSLVFRFNYSSWWESCKWHSDLKNSIENYIKDKLGPFFNGKPPIDGISLSLIESILILEGQETNAETFRALQGFYRALTTIFLFAGLCFLMYVLTGKSFPNILPNVSVQLLSRIFGLLGILCLLNAILTFKRFKNFNIYRIRAILLGFLATGFGRLNN